MKIDGSVLRRAIIDLLVSRGLSEEDATDVSDALVDASLKGVDTHGIKLIGPYLAELEGGRANGKPNMALVEDAVATVVLDADNALGIVAGTAATRIAMQRASEAGICAVCVRNSNHFGRADFFARMMAKEGQIGIVMSNSDALVVPYGGTLPLNGTNPIAFAAPGVGKDGFFLDMATSQNSFTRALVDARSGSSGNTLLDEVDVDKDGNPVRARLQPLGGAKGQGLGTMVQILCALLSDMPFDTLLSNLYREPYSEPRKISHFILCINIGSFVSLSVFKQRLTELLELFRQSPARGSSPVIVAGDKEARIHESRLREGIEVQEQELETLGEFLND